MTGHVFEARRTIKVGGAPRPVHCTAVVDGPVAPRYRYRLTRTWWPDRPHAGWVMLNPSTALADRDDPTIRKCMGFASSWGLGGIVVVNLFALMGAQPAALATRFDPAGPDNARHVEHLFHDTTIGLGPIVLAWGAWLDAHPDLRPSYAVSFAGSMCLGTTESGAPRHPGRIGYDTPLVPYTPQGAPA